MSVQTHAELKGLQTQRDKLAGELKAAIQESENAKRLVGDLRQRLQAVESKIKALNEECQNKGEIVVTEHAYLRYFERVLGFDLDQVKKEIVTPELEGLIKNFKTGVFPGKGFSLRVKNGTITTLVGTEKGGK